MLGILLALFGLALAGGPIPEEDAARREALEQVYARWDWPFPQVETISAEALKARLEGDSPPVLVDVRPPEERQVSMLPGAITQEAFEANREAYAGREVVTYCTVGVRSGFAANTLRKEGLDVKNFRGSIMAWTHIGGELVTPEGEPTKKLHAYGPTWNYAAQGYEPVITKGGEVVPVE